MKLKLEPGVYVVAVSGGVDSMVLLEVLRYVPGLELVVAHFDHGIRPDSGEDRLLVQRTAARYGLVFESEAGNLGPRTSEDTARQARYDFLHRVRKTHGARGIITAHHQDDVLETAVHNLLRGSGRLGMTALRTRDVVIRPLLHIDKAEISAYAKEHKLTWREDSTNTDMRYRRNYIRHKILPKFSREQREELLQHIRQLEKLNDEIDQCISGMINSQPGKCELDRHWFIMLPHDLSREVLATWLRGCGVMELSTTMLERLVMAAKTYHIGKLADIDKRYVLHIGAKNLAIRARDR